MMKEILRMGRGALNNSYYSVDQKLNKSELKIWDALPEEISHTPLRTMSKASFLEVQPGIMQI